MPLQSSTPPAPQTQAPNEPFMVQVSPPAPPREDLRGVLVGAFGLTGALVLAAVVSGAVLASVWIVWRNWRRTFDSDAPPSLGSMPLSPDRPTTRPPSSQDQ